MNIEKQLLDELNKRKARVELESLTPKDFDLLMELALMLFDQNEAHKKLLLMTMELNLTGNIKE